MPGERDSCQKIDLQQAASLLLEECRMVLPGIQALFGFQLIAVFNQGFDGKLDASQQALHLVATGLLAFAIALIMAPAAYHRQTSPLAVSERFIRLATRLLLYSMLPLALGISIEFYVVSAAVFDSRPAAVIAVILFLFIFALWFVLPRVRVAQRLLLPD